MRDYFSPGGEEGCLCFYYKYFGRCYMTSVGEAYYICFGNRQARVKAEWEHV